MKTAFKIVQIINIIALVFLCFWAYGVAITGFLQVISAILFLIIFPKNTLIYIYFILVFVFFLFWNGDFSWFFALPLFLVGFLTFIIYKQKSENRKTLNFGTNENTQ